MPSPVPSIMRLCAVVVLCALAASCHASAIIDPSLDKSDKTTQEVATEAPVQLNTEAATTEPQPPVTEGTEEAQHEDPKSEVTEDKVSYKGSQVVRVQLDNKEKSQYIRQLASKKEVSTWLNNGTFVDVVVSDPATLSKISKKKINYEIIIEDLQRAIDEENPTISEEEWDELVGRKGYRLTWQMYHRMADIHSFMDYMAATYPANVTLTNIGTSVEGRPLRVLEFKSGQPNRPAIWVDAGIHAREWITPASLTYIISQMIEGGDGSRNVDWYFNPLVNPDGYEHSHTRDRMWRKNRAGPVQGSACAGTDLNRNFGYKWGGQGASKQQCKETFAGRAAFSEPETAAIQRFITSKQGQIKGYVSLHSYGQYILYPWGYERRVPADVNDLERVGRQMAAAIRNTGGQSYTVGPAARTLYPASGGSDDWAKGSANIKYSYTVELRDTGRHGFILPAAYIIPSAKDAYAALDVLAKEIGKAR